MAHGWVPDRPEPRQGQQVVRQPPGPLPGHMRQQGLVALHAPTKKLCFTLLVRTDPGQRTAGL